MHPPIRPRITIDRTSRIIMTIALGTLASLSVTPSARAFPPYAEQWFVPGNAEDVDVDGSGRVWVACSDDSIHVFTPSGGIQLFAFGGTGAGNGQFTDPFGMQFASDGSLYVCDYGGARLQHFSSSGAYLNGWSLPGNRADHVAIDAAGDIYVSGYDDLTIYKFQSNGTPVTSWESVQMGRPSGMYVVGSTLFVEPWLVPDIEMYDLNGTFLGSFPSETLYGVDLELSASGQLWLADWINHKIRVFETNGTVVEEYGTLGNGPGEFNNPIGIAFGLGNSVYIADQANNRIERFGDATSVREGDPLATNGVRLLPIAPNPVRDAAMLAYSLARTEPVVMSVVDAGGRTIARVDHGIVPAGEHRLTWRARTGDGQPLAGLYFVRIETPSGASVRRVVVMQ